MWRPLVCGYSFHIHESRLARRRGHPVRAGLGRGPGGGLGGHARRSRRRSGRAGDRGRDRARGGAASRDDHRPRRRIRLPCGPTGPVHGRRAPRGLGGARVLALVNGSRLEDYSWSDEDGPSVDPRLAERIEVIRGPASVLYGSDALGGVVNVIPAELPDANGGPAFARSGLELSGATNNAELGGALRVEGASGRLGWRATAIGRHAADLHTPAGELDNTGFGALSGEAAVGLRGSRGGAALRYARYGGEVKLLEANGPPVPATGEAGARRQLPGRRGPRPGGFRPRPGGVPGRGGRAARPPDRGAGRDGGGAPARGPGVRPHRH